MKISTLHRSLAPAALGVIATLALGCPAEDTPATDDDTTGSSGNDSTTDDDGTTSTSTTTGSTTSSSTTGSDSDSDSGDSDTGVGACVSADELALPEGAVELTALFDAGTAPPPGFTNLSIPPTPFDGSTNPDPGLMGLTAADIVFDAVEGSACPGSVSLTAPFTIYQTVANQGQVNLNVGIPEAIRDWTPFGTLHAWVKLQSATDLTHLNAIGLTVQTGDPAVDPPNFYATFAGTYIGASAVPLDTWTELEFDISTAVTNATTPYDNDNDPTTPDATTPFFVNGIGQFGFQVLLWDDNAAATPPSPPETAPDAPVETTLFVDDVWLELAPPPV